MSNFFVFIYRWVKKNKTLAVFFAVLYLAGATFLGSRISFDEDISKLIPHSKDSDNLARVMGQLKFSDKLTVVLKSEDKQVGNLVAAAQAFCDSLENYPQYVKSVQGKLDQSTLEETLDFVADNLPFFLDSTDYRIIASKINQDSIRSVVEGNYKAIVSPTGFVSGRMVMDDPFGMKFMALKKLQKLGLSSDFILHDGFLLTQDSSRVLLFVNPAYPSSDAQENAVFSEVLYKIKDAIDVSFKKQATVGYFGASVIAAANASQIKTDILTTVVVSIGALLLIFMLYYRKISIPLVVFVPTVFGVLLAVAILAVIKDSISAISLSIGAILVGVTIDYALHILTHYKHSTSVEELYKDITKPLIMSSTTTAVAFLCLLFVRSEALKDLGIFAAISVVASAVFSLLIIPHLYSPGAGTKKTFLDRFSSIPFERSKPLVWLSVVAMGVSVFTYSKVGFNEDISQLNYVPQDVKEVEKDLERATNLVSKSLYVVNYASSEDSVLALGSSTANLLAGLKTKGEVLEYSSLNGLVLSQEAQKEKIRQWNIFWDKAKVSQIRGLLVAESATFGFKPNAYSGFYTLLENSFSSISLADYAAVKAFSLDDFITEKNGSYTLSTLVKTTESSRENVLRAFENERETLVIDRKKLNETFLGQLNQDFNRLVNFSFVAVILILFYFLRRVELVVLSLVPIVITGFITAGAMGALGIELNIFSTIVCTLVFGHGVDFSIFMTSALQKEYTYGKDVMPIYRTSILLAAITTILAIGALVFAHHPALKSISLVALIGVGAALVITFVFYPILFRFLLGRNPKKGKAPFEFWSFITSVLSFTYFGLGGVLFSIMSVLVSFLPGKNAPLLLRKFVSKYMKSVLDTNPNLKKTHIVNPHGEDFSKPAVLIANHTTFLDILAMGMLHPKSIFLVSDWVYNSPVFGKGVRKSGFYPVSKGLEGGVEQMRSKIQEGYSVVVFPEGTRSTDNVVKRFHKGAFYLADYFGLDVVPVIIHGGSDALPKGSFIINKYRLTLEILPRIQVASYGTDLKTQTKEISAYFKRKYADLRSQIEDQDYFKDVIVRSFVYKEPDVLQVIEEQWEQQAGWLYQINKEIPATAKILHLANDYGIGDLILVMQEPQRRVTSWITCEERREVAQTNYLLKKRNITYLSELAANGEDVLIVSAGVEVESGLLAQFSKVFIEK